MKRHTNFTPEIDMHEPDTSWHTTLVGVVVTIAVSFFVFIGLMVMSITMPETKMITLPYPLQQVSETRLKDETADIVGTRDFQIISKHKTDVLVGINK